MKSILSIQIPHRLFLAICLFTFISCENDVNKVNLVTTKKQDLSKETATNVEVLYSENAEIKAKLITPVFDRFETKNPYVEMPEGLQIYFYNQKMEVESELTADYGIRYENEEKMEARENVVVVNKKGEKLNTDRLIWNEKEHKIYSEEFVQITTADEIIYGNGFESNEEFTKYKVFKIKGIITLNENDSTQIN